MKISLCSGFVPGGCRYCAHVLRKDGININASPSNMPRQSFFLPPGVVLKNIQTLICWEILTSDCSSCKLSTCPLYFAHDADPFFIPTQKLQISQQRVSVTLLTTVLSESLRSRLREGGNRVTVADKPPQPPILYWVLKIKGFTHASLTRAAQDDDPPPPVLWPLSSGCKRMICVWCHTVI